MACSVCSVCRVIAVAAAVVTTLVVARAGAQTLAEPNPPPKSSPPTVASRSHRAEHEKACSAYGAGFVQMPGTSACIKIGGYVSVGAAGSGR
jgi:hypothetical protein